MAFKTQNPQIRNIWLRSPERRGRKNPFKSVQIIRHKFRNKTISDGIKSQTHHQTSASEWFRIKGTIGATTSKPPSNRATIIVTQSGKRIPSFSGWNHNIKTRKRRKTHRHPMLEGVKRCGLFSCHGFPLLNRSNNPHSGCRKPKGWWKGETAPEIALIAMTISSTSSNLATTLNLSSDSETRVGNEEASHVSIATAEVCD